MAIFRFFCSIAMASTRAKFWLKGKFDRLWKRLVQFKGMQENYRSMLLVLWEPGQLRLLVVLRGGMQEKFERLFVL